MRAVLGAKAMRCGARPTSAGSRKVRSFEVSRANLAPHAKPARIFIVGARYDPAPPVADAGDQGSGAAAVLELARLLKDLRRARARR